MVWWSDYMSLIWVKEKSSKPKNGAQRDWRQVFHFPCVLVWRSDRHPSMVPKYRLCLGSALLRLSLTTGLETSTGPKLLFLGTVFHFFFKPNKHLYVYLNVFDLKIISRYSSNYVSPPTTVHQVPTYEASTETCWRQKSMWHVWLIAHNFIKLYLIFILTYI